MYVCIYVCVCVCVKETHKDREKQEYHILYYFFNCSYFFVTISNIIFIRKFLVSHNLVFIFFFVFLKFSLVNLKDFFFFFFFFSLASNIMKWLL